MLVEEKRGMNMEHIFRGKVISEAERNHYLLKLEETLNKDLLLGPPDIHMVINAIKKLVDQTDFEAFHQQLINMGMSSWKAEDLINTICDGLTPEALILKIKRELGNDFYEWKDVEKNIQERQQPMGVIIHIGAGNVVALSVLSVLEGLLSGNINILKLPSYEGGISFQLLTQLVKIEPRLEPYIYVFDISSRDTDTIKKLGEVADAIIVWGSDEAISGIRMVAPPSLPIIEWGHRISFAYLTPGEHMVEALHQLANEICLSDQQFCSSPQCLFIETDDIDLLEHSALQLQHALDLAREKYPPQPLGIHEQAEVTWTKELIKLEEFGGTQKLVEGKELDFSIMIDYEPSIKASPLYCNIWLMPIKRDEIMKILRVHKGHLQTVGLACGENEFEELTDLFYKAGVNRITSCTAMSHTYIGEPHDGKLSLLQYTRCVSRCKN